jgi:hypothetical protein
LPSSEPPSIDMQKSIKEANNEEESIKKALLDNMKSVENWKYEQEKLMKEKYEEQQEIESQVKFNLDKIKDDESKRREEVCLINK